MIFNQRPEKSQDTLAWIEWIVTIGIIGLGLSLIIYSYISIGF